MYGITAGGQLGGPIDATDRPYLARISDMADEAGRMSDQLEQFIDRCRGGALSAQNGVALPPPCGHLGHLDRLQDNMARLGTLVHQLNSIG